MRTRARKILAHKCTCVYLYIYVCNMGIYNARLREIYPQSGTQKNDVMLRRVIRTYYIHSPCWAGHEDNGTLPGVEDRKRFRRLKRMSA